MSTVELNDDEIGALQSAVEHLRSAQPDEDDMDGRARRADAAFRIAYKLETIAKRAFADQHPANKKAAATPKDHGGKLPPKEDRRLDVSG